MRVLVLSDLHYPERGNPIPLLEELVKINFDLVIGLGDYGERGLELLDRYFPNVKRELIAGNCDVLDLPETKLLDIKGLKIGLAHGHQIEPRGNLEGLYYITKKLGADILLTGHTHLPTLVFYRDIIVMNPGSAGGAVSGAGIKPPKSALILEIENGFIKESKFVYK